MAIRLDRPDAGCRFMQVCGYPDLDSHREKHRKLEARIREMWDNRCETQDPGTLLQLRAHLRDWWRRHFRKDDRKIRRYTEGREDDIRSILAEVASAPPSGPAEAVASKPIGLGS